MRGRDKDSEATQTNRTSDRDGKIFAALLTSVVRCRYWCVGSSSPLLCLSKLLHSSLWNTHMHDPAMWLPFVRKGKENQKKKNKTEKPCKLRLQTCINGWSLKRWLEAYTRGRKWEKKKDQSFQRQTRSKLSGLSERGTPVRRTIKSDSGHFAHPAKKTHQRLAEYLKQMNKNARHTRVNLSSLSLRAHLLIMNRKDLTRRCSRCPYLNAKMGPHSQIKKREKPTGLVTAERSFSFVWFLCSVRSH